VKDQEILQFVKDSLSAVYHIHPPALSSLLSFPSSVAALDATHKKLLASKSVECVPPSSLSFSSTP
jgi:hypothetical protein